MVAEVLIRPNGKPYRSRKGLRAGAWEDVWGDTGCGVFVLGTLDPDEAQEYASRMCGCWHGMPVAVKPVPGWYRLAMRSGDTEWVVDEVRGAPGVMFTAANEGEDVDG